MYEVVSPLGRLTRKASPISPRVKSLEGMTICELSNHKFGSEITLEVVRKALARRYPGAKFVGHEVFGDTYGTSEAAVVKELADKLRQYGCDAVISGNGG